MKHDQYRKMKETDRLVSGSVFLMGLLIMLLLTTGLRVTAKSEAIIQMRTPTLHALLIVDKSDVHIEGAVNISEKSIRSLLRDVSEAGDFGYDVSLTCMTTDDSGTGKIIKESISATHHSQLSAATLESGIPINSAEVLKWFGTLESNENDTILIYFFGNSEMDSLGQKHFLHFTKKNSFGVTLRNSFRKMLEFQPARLKLLITEIGSPGPRVTEPLNSSDEKVTLRNIPVLNETETFRDLFFLHKGFLDITAATEGEDAWMNNLDGAFFTNSFIESLRNFRDLDDDGFASWEEVFKLTRIRTMQRFDRMDIPELKAKGIQSQRPKYYGELPSRFKDY